MLNSRRLLPMSKEMLTVADHEKFAQAHVRLGTATAAYREVYDPERVAPNSTAWERGCHLAARPDIGARIQYLRGLALKDSQVQVVTLIQDLVDIIRADPNELSRSVVVNCRHCYGDGHEFQWIDVAEFEHACAKVERENEGRKRQKALPEIAGGFGYVRHRAPNGVCPECCGAGELHVIIADTTALSPGALKLYKGIRVKSDGSREVLMHDQMQAREQLHRLVGANKDSLQLPGNVPKAEDLKPGADVNRSYLAMIAGGKRVA